MKRGDIAPNFQLELTNGIQFDLYQTLKQGPVVINFIMGIWCPFCSNHLKKIRDWQDKVGKNVTMLIISSESKEKLKGWIHDNPMSYLFASDPHLSVINLYQAKSLLLPMASPATVLIDTDKSIKIYFNGVRTDRSRSELLEKINS